MPQAGTGARLDACVHARVERGAQATGNGQPAAPPHLDAALGAVEQLDERRQVGVVDRRVAQSHHLRLVRVLHRTDRAERQREHRREPRFRGKRGGGVLAVLPEEAVVQIPRLLLLLWLRLNRLDLPDLGVARRQHGRVRVHGASEARREGCKARAGALRDRK